MRVNKVAAQPGDRYASQRLTGSFDWEAIRAAIITIIGLGTIGELVAQICALEGYGRLILIDNGLIEERNLSRSTAYRHRHIGLPKALVLSRYLEDLNPDVQTLPLVCNAKYLPDELLRHSDVVVMAVDSMLARVWIASYARACGRPVIDVATGANQHHRNWRVSVWMPGPRDPCQECFFTEDDYEDIEKRFPCTAELPGEGPKLGMSPWAAYMPAGKAGEQIRLIVCEGQPDFAGTINYMAQRNVVIPIVPEFMEDCPGHMVYPELRFVDFDGDTTLRELYARVSEKLGLLPHAFDLGYKLPRDKYFSRMAAQGLVCVKTGQDPCGFYKEIPLTPVSRIIAEAEPCPLCGNPLEPTRHTRVLPPLDRPLSDFDLGVFDHLELNGSEGEKLHIVSKRCETREKFLEQFSIARKKALEGARRW